MIEYILTLVMYGILAILSFKSFLIKNTYRASIASMMAFLGFFLYFLDSSISIYQLIFGLSSQLNFFAVNLDILGTVALLFTSTRMKSIITPSKNLLRVKMLNLLFFIVNLSLLFWFNYEYAYASYRWVIAPMIFFQPNLNITYFSIIIILLILINIHLPPFKEYLYLKIIVFGFTVKYIIKIAYVFNPYSIFKSFILIISIIFSIFFLAISYRIYKKSFDLKKET